MPIPFKTGRSRTLTLTATISGQSEEAMNIALGSIGGYEISGELKWFWDATNPSNYLDIRYATSGSSDGSTYLELVADVSVALGSAANSGHAITAGPTSLPLGPSYASLSTSVTGTVTVDMPVEEWCNPYAPTAVTMIDGTNFPNYGGSAYGDGLPAVGVQFYELPTTGGSTSASISVGGASASATVTNASLAIGSVDYLVENLVSNQAASDAHGLTSVSGTVLCQCSLGGVALDGEDSWGPVTDAGGTNSASTTGGAYIQSQTRPLSGPKDFTGTGGTVNWSRTPNIQYSYNARLRSFSAAYPGSVTIDVQDKAGHVTNITAAPNAAITTISQRRQGGTVGLGAAFTATIPTLAEWTPVASWLDTGSLATAGEDSRDWRLQFRGFAWPSITIKRNGDFAVDPCTSTAHWTAGANTTLSAATGHLTAAAAGGVGSLTLAVQTAVRVWEAFRFLSITAGASTSASSPPASIPLTVSLAGQTWTMSVPVGSPAAISLDLTIAGNEATTKNQKGSRFPIKAPGGYPINDDPQDQYAMGWGVDYCDTVTIGGIPDGYTVEIDLVALTLSTATDKEAAITLLEPFLSFIPGWTSGTDNTTVQPYCLLQTDHRVSDVAMCMALVTPTGGGSPNYSWYSIAQIVQLLQYLPGLTVVQLADPSDGYHGAGFFGLMLAGSGATYDWGANTWTDWVDSALNSVAKTIPAQDLWDEAQAYPGAGQVWTGGGAYDIPTPLQVSKSLRAQAWGNAYNTSDVPFPSANVVAFLTSSPSTVVGAAVTGAMGEFVTGAPYGNGNRDITTQFQQGEMPYLSEHSVWQNRSRVRSAFRLSIDQAKPIGMDISRAGEYCRTYTRPSTGTFYLGTAGNPLPQSWADVDSGISATWARCCYAKSGQTNPIGVFYGDGSTCHWAQTDDHGATWTDTTDMASGVLGDYRQDASGLNWFYKIQDDSGTYNIYGKLLDHELNVVFDWTITNLTGVDDSSLAICPGAGSQSDFRIGVFFSQAGSGLTKFAAADGLNFS